MVLRKHGGTEMPERRPGVTDDALRDGCVFQCLFSDDQPGSACQCCGNVLRSIVVLATDGNKNAAGLNFLAAIGHVPERPIGHLAELGIWQDQAQAESRRRCRGQPIHNDTLYRHPGD